MSELMAYVKQVGWDAYADNGKNLDAIVHVGSFSTWAEADEALAAYYRTHPEILGGWLQRRYEEMTDDDWE